MILMILMILMIHDKRVSLFHPLSGVSPTNLPQRDVARRRAAENKCALQLSKVYARIDGLTHIVQDIRSQGPPVAPGFKQYPLTFKGWLLRFIT